MSGSAVLLSSLGPISIVGKTPQIIAATAAKLSQDPPGTLGAWLVGLVLATFSLGVLLSQGVTYFQGFPRDSAWLKLLVATIIFLSFAHVIVVFVAAWDWFVTNFGDWTGVASTPWSISAEPVISQLIVFVTQLFFAYRCFCLTRSMTILVLLVCAMLVSLALSAVIGVLAAIDPYNPVTHREFGVPLVSISVGTDLVITVLTACKLSASQRGVNPNTDRGMEKLLLLTLETAAPPAMMTVVSLTIFLIFGSKNFLDLIFNIIVPRLYVFSLMYTLNSRPYIREIFDKGQTTPASYSFSNTTSSTIRHRVSRDRRTTATILFAPTGATSTIGHSMGIIDEHVGDEDKGGDAPRYTSLHAHLEGSMAESHQRIDLDRWRTPLVQKGEYAVSGTGTVRT